MTTPRPSDAAPAPADGDVARPDATAFREEVRGIALSLGFARCGFAAAGPAPDADRLRAWLAAGHHAGLPWMERDADRRADPRRVVPDCRSVIVLTLRHDPGTGPRTAELPARIARYARGRDYHRVAAVLLRRLKAALAERAGDGHAHRWYVDDGPVLERSWAVAAGIGFPGRNACTIDPSAGSYFLLSVLLTTVPFPPDAPVREHCGTCTACLPACPTGAIVAPGVVDARRCISFWTIEHRGAIPVEFRPLLGTRVFGCDDCQEVCPWNRFARPASHDDLRPRELFADADLAELAQLSEDAFDRRTAGSAVRRVGYAAFLRNVAIALGNTGDARAEGPLRHLAAHPAELVREHAEEALRRLLAGRGAQGDVPGRTAAS